MNLFDRFFIDQSLDYKESTNYINLSDILNFKIKTDLPFCNDNRSNNSLKFITDNPHQKTASAHTNLECIVLMKDLCKEKHEINTLKSNIAWTHDIDQSFSRCKDSFGLSLNSAFAKQGQPLLISKRNKIITNLSSMLQREEKKCIENKSQSIHEHKSLMVRQKTEKLEMQNEAVVPQNIKNKKVGIQNKTIFQNTTKMSSNKKAVGRRASKLEVDVVPASNSFGVKHSSKEVNKLIGSGNETIEIMDAIKYKEQKGFSKSQFKTIPRPGIRCSERIKNKLNQTLFPEITVAKTLTDTCSKPNTIEAPLKFNRKHSQSFVYQPINNTENIKNKLNEIFEFHENNDSNTHVLEYKRKGSSKVVHSKTKPNSIYKSKLNNSSTTEDKKAASTFFDINEEMKEYEVQNERSRSENKTSANNSSRSNDLMSKNILKYKTVRNIRKNSNNTNDNMISKPEHIIKEFKSKKKNSHIVIHKTRKLNTKQNMLPSNIALNLMDKVLSPHPGNKQSKINIKKSSAKIKVKEKNNVFPVINEKVTEYKNGIMMDYEKQNEEMKTEAIKSANNTCRSKDTNGKNKCKSKRIVRKGRKTDITPKDYPLAKAEYHIEETEPKVKNSLVKSNKRKCTEKNIKPPSNISSRKKQKLQDNLKEEMLDPLLTNQQSKAKFQKTVTLKRGTLKYLKERKEVLKEQLLDEDENDNMDIFKSSFHKRRERALNTLSECNDDDFLSIKTPKDKSKETYSGMTPRSTLINEWGNKLPSSTTSSPKTPKADQETVALKVLYHHLRDKKTKTDKGNKVEILPKKTPKKSLLQEDKIFVELGNPFEANMDSSTDDYFDESL